MIHADPLHIGLSPCPNDTFIFYALLHDKVDSRVKFLPFMTDVEELNKKVLKGELPVSKVSFGMLGKYLDDYIVLNSGSAMGRGCGPLLVSKKKVSPEDMESLRIAIPGINTTAALLLKLFAPGAKNLIPMPFFEIPGSVLREEADCGVIIHETRFTYTSYGLHCIKDLGEWWESETGLPIPLGGIVAKRSLGQKLLLDIDRTIHESVSYSIKNPSQAQAFIKEHAQETSPEVIRNHIDLYVNEFTLNMGKEGKFALETLMKKATGLGIFKGCSPKAQNMVLQKKPL